MLPIFEGVGSNRQGAGYVQAFRTPPGKRPTFTDVGGSIIRALGRTRTLTGTLAKATAAE